MRRNVNRETGKLQLDTQKDTERKDMWLDRLGNVCTVRHGNIQTVRM